MKRSIGCYLISAMLVASLLIAGGLSEEACEYVLTGMEGPEIESANEIVEIVFHGTNAVSYTIPSGEYAGWNIVIEWSDPYPERVRCGETFSIGVSARVESAGAGFIGAGINSYIHSGGAVWHIEHNAAAGAGRSGSTGELYSQEDVARYKPDTDADPQFIIDLYLGDGGATKVLLARYVYTRGGTPSGYQVRGQIKTVYDSLGGEAFLGAPTTEELDAAPSTSGTQGKYQNFQNGQIIWHGSGPRAGQAYALWGDILGRYNTLGGTGGRLGFPLSSEADVTPSPYGTEGRFNLFEGGVIIWHSNGPHAYSEFVVEGAIAYLYQSMGGTASYLGMPISDEYDIEGGRRSDFEGGYIIWTRDEGAKAYPWDREPAGSLEGALQIETIRVPADQPEPVYTSAILEVGRYYIIQASGEYSCWSDQTDGVDAYYCYAPWRVGSVPEAWKQLLIDDVPMYDIASENFDPIEYNPDHVYKTTLIGKGDRLKLQISDATWSHEDNSGALDVKIYEGISR
ncbi:MAG: hypothetical protein JW986_05610 [Methanotrichaceae archaeon]|nr:hypothetical protein [Methanotrichaceae archaeon]